MSLSNFQLQYAPNFVIAPNSATLIKKTPSNKNRLGPVNLMIHSMACAFSPPSTEGVIQMKQGVIQRTSVMITSQTLASLNEHAFYAVKQK